MRTWIKGGVLVAIIYLIVQLVDDFFFVFFNITPFEKVRLILYLGTTELYNSFVARCGGLLEVCGFFYIIVIGFVIGAIIGGIVGLSNKEHRRREILREHEALKKGGFFNFERKQEQKIKKDRENEENRRENEKKDKELREKEKQNREEKEKKQKNEKQIDDEDEIPDIEIIPMEGKELIETKKKKEKKRRKKNRKK